MTMADKAADSWKPSTVYALKATCQPDPPNGHTYTCTQAGTSSHNQPMFPANENEPVADGSVMWTCGPKAEPEPIPAKSAPAPEKSEAAPAKKTA
jgi:hypothetical protein